MEKRRKYLRVTLFCVAAFFMLCFLCIGFAALQTGLGIDGNLGANTGDAILSKAKLRAGLQKTPSVTEIFIGNFGDSEVSGLSESDFKHIADVSDGETGFGNSIGLYTIGNVAYVLASGNNTVKFPTTGGFDPNADRTVDDAAPEDHPGYKKGCAYMFASYLPDLNHPADKTQGYDKIACLFNVTQIKFGSIDFSAVEAGYEVEDYDAADAEYEPNMIQYYEDLAKYNNGLITDAPTEPVGEGIFGAAPKYRMFFHCEALTTINIPEEIKKIGHAMFRGCYSLTSVTMSDGLECIGSVAFGDCQNLLSCNIPDSVKTIGVGAFIWCSKLKSVNVEGGVQIPQGVTTIRANAFRGNYALGKLVVLPTANLKHINYGAFYNCSGFSEITIGGGLLTIGKQAFYDCWRPITLTLPDSTTSVEHDAFERCPITAATLPGGVAKCVNHIDFENLDAEGNVNGNLKSVTITSGVIENTAFARCGAITSVTLKEGVTGIGNKVFYKCFGFSEIVIPASVKSIGESAFSDCGALVSITIKNGLQTIGSLAFFGLYQLTSITIPDSVTSVAQDAFNNVPLAEVTIPACAALAVNKLGHTKKIVITSGAKLDDNAFSGCYALEAITIPKSVTVFGSKALYGCGNNNGNKVQITYRGSQAQWDSITKASDWDAGWTQWSLTCLNE